MAKPNSRITSRLTLLVQSKFYWIINDKIYFTSKAYYRSSHLWCSMKKGVFRNLAKLTGKHLCQNLFLQA